MASQGRISDTADEAADVYRSAYSSLSGSDRVQRSIEMAEEVKQITLAGIAHRNPAFCSEQIHREWLRLLHGEALENLIP